MRVRNCGELEFEEAGHEFPLVMRPTQADVVLADWAATHRGRLDEILVQYGAVLFRGLGITTPAGFEDVSSALCGPLLDYVYRSTPRASVGKGIYTASEYRPDASIPLHSENAYQRDWPMKIVFNCQQRAESGGETPLARVDRVSARIDAAVWAAASKGIMYIRNFGQGVDLPWEVAFQTNSRAVVESYCTQHSIGWEWLDHDRLRTKQVCQAVASHPSTGGDLWFNQAHLFHVSSLGAEQRRMMLEVFDETDLPRNAYWGDGTPIGDDVLDHIRHCYDEESLTFEWHAGDVLLCDNMLVAHGRQPFAGARTVLVAMGDAFSQRPAASHILQQ